MTETFGIFDLTDGFTNLTMQSEETTEDVQDKEEEKQEKFCTVIMISCWTIDSGFSDTSQYSSH